ncbi:methyl-accepting chemotaxis protein [Saccharibacillus sp. CPCC 101409]|uniref:methyl-accepting chemotaxis protein n=1 Tax=Saccharibacillus sp. CPCC 101409 TaxID=3058041 RepID=UPI0026716F39|nr:methyl-accepting chemotaxis protein [Saccharibacillus sp. CPCC 101409]MDO3409131.1 methyl-accepting chemotaxis protein [Saccharibacillus sp. CPCC 101409]
MEKMRPEEYMEKLKEAFETVLPIVQDVFPLDVMFALTDTEKFRAYLPGKEVAIPMRPDMPIPPRSGIRGALDEMRTISANLGEEVYGTAFKSVSKPLRDESGQAAGVLTLGISLKNQQILDGAAEHLAQSSGEVRTATHDIAQTATDLASEIGTLKEIGQSVVSELKKTDDILRFIKEVSENSTLLGINASIEAAHAGEQGRGFGVVAKEIRKMAESSAASARQIEQILATIQNRIQMLDDTLGRCAAQSEHQAAATEEIAASMEQLAESAAEIKSIAKLL